jgi:hypothetical protein
MGFGSSNCIDFESQDELQWNFGPTLLQFMISMCGGLWCMDESRLTGRLTETGSRNIVIGVM